MAETESRSGEEVLAESRAAAAQADISATTELARSQSERVMVERAQALRTDLVVVGARESLREQLLPGPHENPIIHLVGYDRAIQYPALSSDER